jgi:hypothetical protein
MVLGQRWERGRGEAWTVVGPVARVGMAARQVAGTVAAMKGGVGAASGHAGAGTECAKGCGAMG